MSGEAADVDAAERLYVLYGSETGNAESIAKRLHHDAVTTHGFPGAECMTLNQAVTKKLFDEQLVEDTAKSLCVVLVCSTMGEGEPPQNAARFRRWLRNTVGKLHRVRYCLLALGDTNYNNFCAPGVFMDNKLSEMGGVRCYPRGEADDGVGLHLVVDPWVEGVWAALKQRDLGGGSAGGAEAVGHEKYTTGETRIDMSVAQEAAILYSNASHVCASTALFLYERITELGGKADLYPVQCFHPGTSLTRPPKVLLFLLSTESDADAGCERCAGDAVQAPPLGPFAGLLCSTADPATPLSPEALELQRWMSDPALRFYNSLLLSTDVDAVTALNAALARVATACKLEPLCRRQASGEVPSIAASEVDVFVWVEGVLDSLPGVTADAEHIHRTMELSFDNRVGAVFRAAAAVRRRLTRGEESDDGVTSATGSTRTRRRYHLHDAGEEARDRADVAHASSRSSVPSKTHQVLDDLLTPVVFLYSDSSSFVKQCAMDIFAGASQHHLRSSICELSNFRQTGFPRRATFVFIVSGVLTKSMARVLKVLRTLQSQGKQVEGVSFAILGVDKTSHSDKFNACALELETLLLEMQATKIHCTGLADVDSNSLAPIIQSWESNLWSAIIHPMKSAAYLDMASPNIRVQRGFPPLTANGHPVRAALAVPSASVGAPATEGADEAGGSVGGMAVSGGGGGGGNSAIASAIFRRFVAADGGAGLAPLFPSAEAGLQFPPDVPAGAATASPAGAGEVERASPTVAAAGFAGALFPWETIPLRKENAARTPVALLYASACMSRTIAMHAMRSAEEKGFPTVLHSFANFQRVDYHAYPSVLLFCEAGPDGHSNGGRRLKKFLTNPSHSPDTLSHVRFAVLGLGATPTTVVHPAFLWAKMLSRMQASRVFPVLIMPSMSQLHTLGMPWVECALASMALLPTPVVAPAAILGGRVGTQVDSNGPLGPPAAMADPEHSDSAAVDPLRCVVFLFGSSTGICESIARDLHREALERGFLSRVAALKYFQNMSFLSTANVVLVCSTVASAPGGLPRNARSFARFVLAKDQPPTLLSETSFAVLGLGSGSAAATTAPEPAAFCRAADRFDRRMAELGGRRLCAAGLVDASQAIAEPVEAWRKTMFAALEARATERAAASLGGAVVTRLVLGQDGHHRDRSVSPPWTGEGAAVAAAAPQTDSASAGAVAEVGSSRRGRGRALLAYCCAPASVVVELADYLAQTIAETTAFDTSVCTMNELLKRNWRSEFDMIVFVAGQSEDAEYPLNGSAFARVVRQRSAPLDLFAAVSYTVLAVSDKNGSQFYMGRQLDRRLEELGGTRVYARGEVVDSFRLEKTVERWSGGLLAFLTSLGENPQWDGETRGAAQASSISDTHGPGSILRRLHRSGAVAATAAAANGGAARTRQGATGGRRDAGDTAPGGSASALPVTGVAAAGDHGDNDDDAVEGDEGGEDAQSFVSAEVGSGSADASTAADLRTESSMVNRVAYSADNAGDRADGVLRGWRMLTSPAVRHPVLQLDLSVSAGTQWAPGQTIAVLPSNSAADVEALLHLVKVKHHEPFHPLSLAGPGASVFPTSPLYAAIDFPVSCGTVLLRYVELRVSGGHKALFQLLEQHCTSAEAKAAVQSVYGGLLTSRVPRDLREVLEAVTAVGGALPPLRHILENLTLVQPRQYSICSSHRADPTTLSICFKVVEKGLCTGWMYEQCLWVAGLSLAGRSAVPVNTHIPAKRRVVVPFVIRRASEFRMPRDPLVPMILIGPGTGIAPFRAFLQEREAWLTERQPQCSAGATSGRLCGCPGEEALQQGYTVCGSIDVFFGCRRRRDDYLFRDELTRWEENGVVHSLTVAFSREPNDGGFWYGGNYVQDRMQECAVALMNLILQRNAHVFVCGDADNMAREVHNTLRELIQQHLSLTDAAAAEYLDQMSRDGRYLRDVWSTGV
ncbi:methionine synthase reductase, mitochondrial precursor-like protein [Novymonas esmeraldas]|uniref:NADPH--hemoprotein reductase n=1 Tax=Novymonas esmeraldas TaxID=1808958 RepID=A0AAW0F442_9TRYP